MAAAALLAAGGSSGCLLDRGGRQLDLSGEDRGSVDDDADEQPGHGGDDGVDPGDNDEPGGGIPGDLGGEGREDSDDGDPPDPEAKLGSAARPIRIDAFPFVGEGDTRESEESLLSAYGCAPEVDESGPEVHYEVVLDRPGLLLVEVEDGEEVDVDIHLLDGPDPEACIARDDAEIERTLAAGIYRLVVDTYRDLGLAGAYRLELRHEEVEPEPAVELTNEYYYLAEEADHVGPRDTALYDTTCRLIGHVREEFHDALCIEGSGVLEEGVVVNYGSTCTESCSDAPTCSAARRVCYAVLDATTFPWGMGAAGVALVPDVSIAIDCDVAPLGAVLYVEELDGVTPPGGSDPHDGCVRVDDSGAIAAGAFRLFAGSRDRWRAWEDLLPKGSTLTAFVEHPACFGL